MSDSQSDSIIVPWLSRHVWLTIRFNNCSIIIICYLITDKFRSGNNQVIPIFTNLILPTILLRSHREPQNSGNHSSAIVFSRILIILSILLKVKRNGFWELRSLSIEDSIQIGMLSPSHYLSYWIMSKHYVRETLSSPAGARKPITLESSGLLAPCKVFYHFSQMYSMHLLMLWSLKWRVVCGIRCIGTLEFRELVGGVWWYNLLVFVASFRSRFLLNLLFMDSSIHQEAVLS